MSKDGKEEVISTPYNKNGNQTHNNLLRKNTNKSITFSFYLGSQNPHPTNPILMQLLIISVFVICNFYKNTKC